MKLGLINNNPQSHETSCVCSVQPWQPKNRKKNTTLNNSDIGNQFWDIDERIEDLEIKLLSTSLKNHAGNFQNRSLPEKSSYVEVSGADRRLVFRKTSLCWFFGKDKRKCSSDRRIRVMCRNKNKNRSKKFGKGTLKTFKP